MGKKCFVKKLIKREERDEEENSENHYRSGGQSF